MASIRKHKDGYRAEVYVMGRRDSKVCPTKREATTWGIGREAELQGMASGQSTTHTLHQALAKFAEEVSPDRRGTRWEVIRLAALAEQLDNKKLVDVTPDYLNDWRKARLQGAGGRAVKPGTVLREIALLSAVFEAARLDWKWIRVNPVADMRKPPKPPHRDRTIGRWEIRRVLRQLGHARQPRTVSQAAALAFCLALRTGMRAGELCGLPWGQVKPDYVVLPLTKNGKGRHVPLSPKAQLLLARARGIDEMSVFNLKSQSLDALFRKARKAAGLEGFTFHDSRHTAATWIAPKLDIPDLCKMFGWSDPKQAMVYYNPTASTIASRL